MTRWTILATLFAAGCSSSGGTAPSPGSDAAVVDAQAEGSTLDSSSVDSSASDAATPCAAGGGFVLNGQLNGMAVDQSYMTSGGGNSEDPSASPPDGMWADLDPGGLLYGVGTGTSLASVTLQAGVVILPPDGPDPGGLYCIVQGSFSETSTSDVWSLTSLARAGACPSSGASEGDWTGCIADSFWTPEDGGTYEGAPCIAGETHLVGSLGGTPFDWQIPEGLAAPGGGGSASGSNVGDWVAGIGDLGVIVLQAAGGDAAEGTVIGTLHLPTSVSPGGAFFCIPPASTATYTDHAIRFTLRGVTSAGSCSAATSSGSHVAACEAR
jgi:hypothetical protein